MSELKEYELKDGAYGMYLAEDGFPVDEDVGSFFYPKEQADKAIADKDKEIAELKEHVKSLILDNYLKDKELRRHKYKRCLAMAEWCSYKSEVFDQYSRHTDYIHNIEKYRRKRDHYADRSNKLLLLAEKFKEKN